MKELVSVVIRGEPYTIRAAEDPSYVQRVAAYVDAKLEGVAKGSPALPPTKAVVLASLNIADELFKAEAERERSEGVVAARLRNLSALLETALDEGGGGPRVPGVNDQERSVAGGA